MLRKRMNQILTLVGRPLVGRRLKAGPEDLERIKLHNEVLSYTTRLKESFNQFTELNDPDKLKNVADLTAEIGKIDLKTEGLKSDQNQRDLTVKFHWGHNHQFNKSTYVEGRMKDRHIELIPGFILGFNLDQDYFKNKDVIDVGCWTGGTTLMLKHLGAKKILALEEVKKYILTTERLIDQVYELDDVSCVGTSLFDLETDYKYDIAYCPGVVYHLSDPVLGLRRLFNALKDGGECLIETAGIVANHSVSAFLGSRVYHSGTTKQHAEEKTRGGWNWFLPSLTALQNWMAEAGFEDIEVKFESNPRNDRIYAYGRRNKFKEITRAGFSRPDIE